MLKVSKTVIQAALGICLLLSVSSVQATLLTQDDHQLQSVPEVTEQGLELDAKYSDRFVSPVGNEFQSPKGTTTTPVIFQRELVANNQNGGPLKEETLEPYSLVHGLVYASFGFLLVVLGVAGSRYNKI